MSDGPVYLRLEHRDPGSQFYDPGHSAHATLVEVLPDGTAGRDIAIGADGKLLYVTRASQAEVGGPWETFGPAAPGTPEWDENWGSGVPISAEEFEAIYAEADATLPWTWGGTPTWVSCVVPVLAIVVVGLLLMWWGGTFT